MRDSFDSVILVFHYSYSFSSVFIFIGVQCAAPPFLGGMGEAAASLG